jgi:hypothetical protein
MGDVEFNKNPNHEEKLDFKICSHFGPMAQATLYMNYYINILE